MAWQLPKPRLRAKLPEVRRDFALRIAMTRAARRVLVFSGVGLALAVAVLPGGALAHVEIDVGDGQYVMEVGFRDEPAYLGQPNALALSVERYATGGTEPVNDLAATLSAEVSRDGQVTNLPLVPVGEGEYEGAKNRECSRRPRPAHPSRRRNTARPSMRRSRTAARASPA